MNILIVGTGYVGLVTGSCFAEMGHRVICLDIDEEKIKLLQKGRISIFEPGLEEIVRRNLKAGRLSFTTDYTKVKDSSLIFIAVPSPSKEDGSCDISCLEKAAREIANYMQGYKVLVIKSTVPMGTTHHIQKIVEATIMQKQGISFDIVFNPEFLKQGNAVLDCMRPDRIILGSQSTKALDIMKKVYAPFSLHHEKIIEMDIISAEMTKYAANAMLACRISFMNEIAEICNRYSADINKVRKGIGSDPRIGYSFLYAGVGYGGSCFPKDLRALLQMAKKVGYTPSLLKAIEDVNNKQKKKLVQYMERYFLKKGGIKGKTIAIWGLSFKPDTDDLREAPSVTLIDHLLAKGAILKLFDPVTMAKGKKLFQGKGNLFFCKDENEAAKGADAIALLTEWKQFRLLDFSPIIKNMKGCAFFDGRNQYCYREMKAKGFDYIGMGVPDVTKMKA